MLLIHGKRKFFIRFFEPLFYKCPYCDAINSTEVFIYSHYFHLFWIPVFPYKKEAIAKCTECDTTRSEQRFGPKLTEHLKEELNNTKHPFYSWTLLIILALLILFILIVAPKKIKNPEFNRGLVKGYYWFFQIRLSHIVLSLPIQNNI